MLDALDIWRLLGRWAEAAMGESAIAPIASKVAEIIRRFMEGSLFDTEMYFPIPNTIASCPETALN